MILCDSRGEDNDLGAVGRNLARSFRWPERLEIVVGDLVEDVGSLGVVAKSHLNQPPPLGVAFAAIEEAVQAVPVDANLLAVDPVNNLLGVQIGAATRHRDSGNDC